MSANQEQEKGRITPKTPWKEEGVILPRSPKTKRLEEVLGELRRTAPPAGVSKDRYGHALNVLQTLADSETAFGDNPTKKQEIQSSSREKLIRKVKEGILPQGVLDEIDNVLGKETFDALGWEKEPKEWRE